MNPKIFHRAGRILTTITLAEWGGILTYFYCSDRITAYLHPNLRPLVLLTGILLVVSAGCVLCRDETCSQSACGNEGCATRHRISTLGGLLSFGVLLLPLALAAKISPDSFGSGFIENRGVRKTILAAKAPPDRWASVPIFMGRGGAQAVAGPALPGLRLRSLPASATGTRQPLFSPRRAPTADDYRAVGIFDLMRAAQSPFARQDLEGRRVGLTGRFFPKNANHFELVCTLVTCCAVDAQLLALRVETNDIPVLDKLTWTKVIGRVSFVKEGEDTMPVITAERIATIPAPREPLVFGPSHPLQPNRPGSRR